MKAKRARKTGFILLCIGTLLVGCKKTGCMDEFAVNYDPQSDISNNQFCFYNTPSTQNYAPNFGPNTAMLLTRNGQKVYHDSKIGSYSTWSYYCSAQFIGSDGNRLDAGVVEMHGYVDPPAFDSATFSPLPQHGDNFYSMKTNIQPGQFPQYFPGEIKWRASGAQWPAFNYTNTVGFPNRSVPQSGDPSISTDYIFQASPVANADSLVLQIFGQRHTITKTISADKSSKRFTSQELKKIGMGNAILIVIAVRYDVKIDGNRTYYLLKTKRSSKSVRIID